MTQTAERTPRSAAALDDSTRLAFRSHTRCTRRNDDVVDQNRDFANHFRLQHLQILSDRSAGKRTTESPHRTARVRARASLYWTRLAAAGYPGAILESGWEGGRRFSARPGVCSAEKGAYGCYG